MVTNEQLYLAVGIPLLFNATLIGVLIAVCLARKFLGSEARKLREKLDAIEVRFDAIDRRFDAMDQRFDDMRDLWRAELRPSRGTRPGRAIDSTWTSAAHETNYGFSTGRSCLVSRRASLHQERNRRWYSPSSRTSTAVRARAITAAPQYNTMVVDLSGTSDSISRSITPLLR